MALQQMLNYSKKERQHQVLSKDARISNSNCTNKSHIKIRYIETV